MTITREQIIAWAKDAGLIQEWMVLRDEDVARLARLVSIVEQHVRQDENEQCERVCDERKIITPEWQLDQHYNQAATHCAAAIRARRNKV